MCAPASGYPGTEGVGFCYPSGTVQQALTSVRHSESGFESASVRDFEILDTGESDAVCLALAY